MPAPKLVAKLSCRTSFGSHFWLHSKRKKGNQKKKNK